MIQNVKKKEEEEEKFDVRVLKGIPDYSDVPEYKELAAYLARDILVENPNVKFEDIIGLERAKSLIMEAVTLPLKYPQCFVGITEAWKGILLYGPPGTGKVSFVGLRQCWQRQWLLSARLLFSTFQLRRWCRSGEGRAKN